MASPFPGMDPYLEDPAVWQGFHGEFIYACRQQLLERLPDNYDADVNERVRLVRIADEEPHGATVQDVLPDVTVTRFPGPARTVTGAGGSATLDLEPVTITVPEAAEVVDRWIEVRHRPDNTLVTVIEVLSPTNKTADGFGEYQAKRQAILRQRVNLVELDLLVGGRRVERSAGMPTGDYFAIVSRADEPTQRFVYAWPIRRPLPRIPVPLAAPDPDVVLDLAAAFTTAYERGRYQRRLRYGEAPPASLSRDDLSWAAGVGR